ncbi:SDR family oxidoreductase [Rhodoblastus sp. 17X3]|uniref:SDR family NAD(P)-dependent oxidoreductase n=1 Tax=Rhodoblastus sp. 17X3 TaxID=3047026 RepID=UPI0024B6A148|nr:SDR family oxidoreductase [Rhodoblastus sp. 17X3]MDI9847310.1 SDR family oxidoreductase [Rhodoblastus sp. 17X3]
MNLNGKTAIVTGGGAGLGRAITLAYARAGARLVVCDINDHALDETTTAVKALGAECLSVHCDVSSSGAVASMFEQVCTQFGTVHVLVNNAATIPARPEDEARRNMHYAYLTTPLPRRSLGFTSAMTDEDWHRFWDVNVHGVFYCTREALRRMEPQKDGKIINIASIAGLSAFSAHSPHYSATKGAVIAFTRAVAAEVAGANIFVNAIAPGGVHTEIFDAYLNSIGEQGRNQLSQMIPLGRLGTPDEYASLALYLACDGHYLVGQTISPNGGMI